MYNLTALDSAFNIFEITKATNNMTNGFLAIILLFVIFIISFFAMKRYQTFISLIASSFIVSIISIGFFYLELITTQILIIPILLLIIGIFIFIFLGE